MFTSNNITISELIPDLIFEVSWFNSGKSFQNHFFHRYFMKIRTYIHEIVLLKQFSSLSVFKHLNKCYIIV